MCDKSVEIRSSICTIVRCVFVLSGAMDRKTDVGVHETNVHHVLTLMRELGEILS